MRLKVTFETVLPETTERPTNDQILAWLHWELHANSELSLANPLSRKELEADFWSVDYETIWTDGADGRED